ncbi:precorrin-6A synthase [Nocardioides massiliensis]|uniref:Precorrin-6A synthase n=2 Tax=Nocardioides massiliensis TaxID=1325935 RepID=A0ABT9NLF4_9ACTN|nr:precorrin-6A synthase (deacetylating) [Nocardioides massiliensis]MDP9821176.1 precorrin-6A synthase [Nocardioides massiliensis]
MSRLVVVGFGMGPQHLTDEARAALGGTDYVIAFRKGPDDPLLAVRREICGLFGLDLVEIDDPERDRADPVDYPAAVRAWHRARVDAVADVLRSRDGGAAFLVWGDPSLYDSTLRLVQQVAAVLPTLTWTAVAGISAPSLLAARHRIVLHEVGEPVHVTPARHLREAIVSGQRSIVAMLCSSATFDALEAHPRWRIWWGANLGAPSERLLAGRVVDVLPEIVAARAAAKAEAGWVMDSFLLRPPGGER